MNLSKEQKEIVEAPIEEQTVVMATAASGKTHVATQRLIHILKKGLDAKKVVLLTFTNNAGAEMASRIPDDLREGLFVGTMHSYANMLLSSHGIDTSKFRDEEEFDELFNLIYENPQVLRELDYLVVDEAQDLNEVQFDFIEFLKPRGFLVVGDVRQSIYGFKNATPKRLLYMMKDQMNVTRELTENYRNAKSILSYSNKLIQKMSGIALTKIKGQVASYGKVKRIGRFDILPVVLTDHEWSNWAILCRANRTVDSILGLLKRNNIPAITFRQAQGTLEDLNTRMKENAVKVLTIHSAKGLQFKKVIVVDVFTKGQENIRLNYVSVTRAMEELYLVGK